MRVKPRMMMIIMRRNKEVFNPQIFAPGLAILEAFISSVNQAKLEILKVVYITK